MGRMNDILMDYLRDEERFADLFNGSLFHGEQVVHGYELEEGSEIHVEKVTEATKNGGSKRKSRSGDKTVLRTRDIKKWMRSGCELRILAVENQNLVDYTMHWRGMNYDDQQYSEQIRRIRKRNERENKLKTSAEKLCGLSKEDRLVPVFSICLYHGEEPWDGPRSLKDMMDFGEDGERWEKIFSDYRMQLVCLNEMTDYSCFHSPLKDLFALIPYRKDKKALKKFMEENQVYQSLDEETALAASALIGIENFEENMEQYYEEEGYNMCTALREMVEDSRAEGKEEGRREGVLHTGMRCYLNALSRGISHEDAMAIAEITEENAIEAVKRRDEGKI